jgi:virginiamycin B lyase
MPQNRRFLTAAAVALLAAGLAALALPSSGAAYIYWPVGRSIRRADLDGRHIEKAFITQLPHGPRVLGTGAGDLYVGLPNGLLARIRANGVGPLSDLFTTPRLPTVPEGLPFENDVGPLVVAGRFVYWAAIGNHIGRARLDGSDLQTEFLATAGRPDSLAVYGGRIYWVTVNGTAVGRARLDGSHVEPSFIPIRTATSKLTPVPIARNRLYERRKTVPAAVGQPAMERSLYQYD